MSLHSGVVAPIIGGLISLFIWLHKRSVSKRDMLEQNFNKIENSVIELSVVVKNNTELLKDQHRWMQSMDRKINIMDKRLWDISDRRDR